MGLVGGGGGGGGRGGERDGLHIESELDEGTVVTIKIPAIVYSEENRLQFEEHHIV